MLAQIDSALLRELASELVRAHRKGDHLVSIDRAMVDSLIALGGFSLADEATLKAIKAGYTQTGRLYTDVRKYVLITNHQDERVATNGNAIEISFRAILNSRMLERPKLLVENVDRDGWMYSLILRSSRSIGYGALSFEVYHGGGSDIKAVLDHLIGSKFLVTAIVDTDRDCPEDLKNTKLNGLRTVLDNRHCVTAQALSPPCRELENMLPLSVIFQIPSAVNSSTNELLANIEDYENRINCEADQRLHLYFDFKGGINADKSKKKSSAASAWIEAKLSACMTLDQKWSVVGYGDHIIDQVKNSNMLIAQFCDYMRKSAWRHHFELFNREICWMFVSERKSVT